MKIIILQPEFSSPCWRIPMDSPFRLTVHQRNMPSAFGSPNEIWDHDLCSSPGKKLPMFICFVVGKNNKITRNLPPKTNIAMENHHVQKEPHPLKLSNCWIFDCHVSFPRGYINQSTTKDFVNPSNTIKHPSLKAPGDFEGGFMLGRCMFHLSVGSVGKVAGHRFPKKAGWS